jgi:T5orf172 domain
MEPKAGYVYLIQAGSMDRFKIGCATDVDTRLAGLETASAVPLRLIGKKKSPDMYAAENAWHKLFAANRVKGEWFDLDAKQFLKIAREFKAEFRVHSRDRVVEDLKIGGIYYISVDGINTIQVELVELEYFNDPNKFDHAIVNEIRGRQSWSLFPDEVRTTPIGALFNYVTN